MLTCIRQPDGSYRSLAFSTKTGTYVWTTALFDRLDLRTTMMTTILIVVLLVFLLGGGGYYGRGRYW
jgi:hypothetical protein